MFRTAVALSLCLLIALIAQVIGQGPEGPGNRAQQGPGGRGGPQQRDLIADFDTNKNGRLEASERSAAIEDLAKNPAQARRGPRGRRGGPGGRRGGPPGRAAVVNTPGRKMAKTEVESFPDKSLYDDSILRTFFIDFEDDNWEKEMGLLKDYGVDVGAKVTVDETVYEDVGIRFRGNSSFFTLGEGQKRSLNLTFDWVDEKQDLYGYRTLNLLNSHADASYLRLALYSHIARKYTAVPKSNYVHVVINGESWGIYVNEQQMNTDFMKEQFDSRKGHRFKAPPGRGGPSFAYKSDDKADYTSYEIKSKDSDEAWDALINAIKVLDKTPVDKIETDVDPVLSIDRALWFLAVDNVLLDMDGYYKRGADYAIYIEPDFGRTFILPYDCNETFRAQGGGGPGGPGGRRGGLSGLIPGFGGPPPGGGPPGGGGPGDGGPPDSFGSIDRDAPPFALDIFASIDQKQVPLISKLLKNPAVKARYVAHVRTIYQDWIDWNDVSPIIDKYRNLIGDEIKKDTRKLQSTKDYEDGIGMSSTQGRDTQPGLKAFFIGRKEYLDQVPELQQPFPEFESVDAKENQIFVTLKAKTTEPDKVFLYWSDDPMAAYRRTELTRADEDRYVTSFPSEAKGKKIFFYVEARTADEYLTTSFYPELAESKPLSAKNPNFVKAKTEKPNLTRAESSDVVINEIMAANRATIANSQGEFMDWIELANNSTKVVDLSGMYLSDSAKDPRKFEFPAGTQIPAGGVLVVWAGDAKRDVDGTPAKGIYTGFKLAKSGETVLLIQTKNNEDVVLDSLEFGELKVDQSFGRNSKGKTVVLKPTPGVKNRP